MSARKVRRAVGGHPSGDAGPLERAVVCSMDWRTVGGPKLLSFSWMW